MQLGDTANRLSDALATRLKAIIADDNSAHGYRIRRRSYFFGKLINHCGWDRDYNVRLFRTERGRYTNQRVHATVTVDGEIESIDEPMYHDDKRNFEEYFATFQRFTSWSAQDLFERGYVAKRSDVTLRPLARFIKMYILRQGFRDGYHGAVLCGLAAFSVFTKYAKVWNLQRLANGGSDRPPDSAA